MRDRSPFAVPASPARSDRVVDACLVPRGRCVAGRSAKAKSIICSFRRRLVLHVRTNGAEYPSDKAREHLATKYQFAGSRISTAEEFIRYLATQSSISGELYHVKCGKADALSGVWLTNELKRFARRRACSTFRADVGFHAPFAR